MLSAFPGAAARGGARRSRAARRRTCGPARAVTNVAGGRVEVGAESHRRRDHPLGGGRRGLAARRHARRAGRPGRARARRAGSDDSRFPHGVRHRRPGVARRRRRQAAAGRRAGRDADGGARGAQHHAGDRAAALPAVRLQGPRRHGDDRPRVGRRRFRMDAAQGMHRLARLAVRPHPQSDRLPQPARRPGAVGVVVLQLPARDQADHRTVAGIGRDGDRDSRSASPSSRWRSPRRSCRCRRGWSKRGIPAASIPRSRASSRRSATWSRSPCSMSRRSCCSWCSAIVFVAAGARGWLGARSSRALSLVTLAAVVLLLFLALWGLNYRRVPLERSSTTTAPRHARGGDQARCATPCAK